MGSHLYALMKDLHLEIETFQSELVLQTKETGSDLAWVLEVMMNRMLDHEIADEVQLRYLIANLNNELEKSDFPFIRDTAFIICAKLV